MLGDFPIYLETNLRSWLPCTPGRVALPRDSFGRYVETQSSRSVTMQLTFVVAYLLSHCYGIPLQEHDGIIFQENSICYIYVTTITFGLPASQDGSPYPLTTEHHKPFHDSQYTSPSDTSFNIMTSRDLDASSGYTMKPRISGFSSGRDYRSDTFIAPSIPSALGTINGSSSLMVASSWSTNGSPTISFSEYASQNISQPTPTRQNSETRIETNIVSTSNVVILSTIIHSSITIVSRPVSVTTRGSAIDTGSNRLFSTDNVLFPPNELPSNEFRPTRASVIATESSTLSISNSREQTSVVNTSPNGSALGTTQYSLIATQSRAQATSTIGSLSPDITALLSTSINPLTIMPSPTPITVFTSTSAIPSSIVILSAQPRFVGAEGEGVETRTSNLIRRQVEPGFIGKVDVTGSSNCSDATLFRRSRGELQLKGRPISVDPGVAYINLMDYPDGSITTRFSVINDTLVWTSSAFYEGQAGFCEDYNGDIFISFTEAGGPSGCMPIDLRVYRGNYFLRTPLRTID